MEAILLQNIPTIQCNSSFILEKLIPLPFYLNVLNRICSADSAYLMYLLNPLHTSLTHTVQWAVELDRFQLAAGGGEWSGPNMSLWLLFSFMLGSAWRGET